jgi:ABC-type antimicrobial peptide transport system permease subunit
MKTTLAILGIVVAVALITATAASSAYADDPRHKKCCGDKQSIYQKQTNGVAIGQSNNVGGGSSSSTANTGSQSNANAISQTNAQLAANLKNVAIGGGNC